MSITTIFFSQELISNNLPAHVNKEEIMNNEIVYQDAPMTIIGIACRTSNAPDAGPRDIPQLWAQFFQEGTLNKIPNKLSNTIIALYCDYEGDYTKPYSLVIGCPVSSCEEIPEAMVAKTIPQGQYCRFSAVGEHPQALVQTWNKIWQNSDLKRTYIADFEVYSEKFSNSPQEVEVMIGIH